MNRIGAHTDKNKVSLCNLYLKTHTHTNKNVKERPPYKSFFIIFFVCVSSQVISETGTNVVKAFPFIIDILPDYYRVSHHTFWCHVLTLISLKLHLIRKVSHFL